MKKVSLFICLFIFGGWFGVNGQSAFTQKEFIDINNIKASQLVHGDMWFDPNIADAVCEFPKNSGKNIAYCGSIWMAGYDPVGKLHAAAQTYRQTGNDYWPGPHGNDTLPLPYATSAKWAKIWKVNRTTINYFLTLSNHTLTNTPAAILEWPAKGNPYAKGDGGVALTITDDLAPFVDVNNDGIYSALNGDYPLIKGDQMLWNVFNDNGASHTQTGGLPLNVSVNLSVYGYQRNSPIDNILYYEYNITNKSPVAYDSFAVGIFADEDLGYSMDDYVGFDSSRRMGFSYNGRENDSMINASCYGDTIPMMGVRILELPGDSCNNYAPLGSFMYIRNDTDYVRGFPVNDVQFNNYLRHHWRNGHRLAAPYYSLPSLDVYDDGTGPGAPVNYVYDGSLQVIGSWNECEMASLTDDYSMIMASKPFTLHANQTIRVSFALIASPPKYHNGCPFMDYTQLGIYSDTAQKIYCNPLPLLTSGVNDITGKVAEINIHPNPASELLFIDKTIPTTAQLRVMDALGRNMPVHFNNNGSKTEVNISQLPTGMYLLIIENGNELLKERFVKE